MRQINLLPPEARVRAVQQRTTLLFVGVVLLAIGSVGVSWFVVRNLAESTADTIAARTIAATAFTPAQGIEALQRADVIQRTVALNTLAKSEVNWPKVFGLFQALIPKEITLVSTTYSVNAAGLSLHAVGEAPSNLSFASFAETFKASPNLSKVVVDGFTYNSSKGTVTFAVTLSMAAATVNYPAL